MNLSKIEKQLNRIEKILTEQMDKSMSFVEACEYLNISKAYLYKCTHRRLIPYHKPGGKKIFFSKKDLDKWIFRNRIRSEAELDEEVNKRIYKINI